MVRVMSREADEGWLLKLKEWDSQHRFLTWYVAIVTTLILFFLIQTG